MATLLLIVIYFAFIGLGLPDSIFGSAWPVIAAEFDLPLSYANFITLICSFCTVVSSLLSPKVTAKLGPAITTAVSTALTALALLGFYFSNSFLFICLLSLPLGLGAGGIDTALNNYVAVHYKASHMNFLHCFYGIGVTASPFLMSLALFKNGDWRNGYFYVFLIQAGITLIALLAIPLWKKVAEKKRKELGIKEENKDENKDETPKKSVKLLEVCKIKKLRLIWIIFFGTCALEFTCGTWGSSFFVGAKGVTEDVAALAITFYYAGIAVGRFISGLISDKVGCWKVVIIGHGIVLVGVILLFIPVTYWLAIVGLFLIGLGNGPVFPILAHLTPKHFGIEKSETAMGTQMAACYVGCTLMPIIFGFIAKAVSIKIYPIYLLLMYFVMILGSILFKNHERKEEKTLDKNLSNLQ